MTTTIVGSRRGKAQRFPELSRHVVARTRLIEQFPVVGDDGTWGRGRTAVWASAGAGKTTLTAQWCALLRSRGVPTLWFTVDSISPPTRRLAPMLEHERREGVLAKTGPVALVVDDVHLTRDLDEQVALWQMLDDLPRAVTVVLLGRYDPFSRLRTREPSEPGAEIRGSALSFTETEARELFARRGVQLGDLVLRDLMRRTEGWVTGLCLCADGLVQRPDPEQWIASFTGADQAVADYLVCEVMDNLAPDIRDFLLSTCVVDQLPVSFAVALSGRTDSGCLLDELSRMNRFVHRTAEDDVFEYHQLFRCYLRAELGHRDLRRRHAQEVIAARWLDSHGLVGPALGHAVASEDPLLVQQLISRQGFHLTLSGEGAALLPALALLRDRGCMTASAHLVAVLAERSGSDLQYDADYDLAAAGHLLLHERDSGLELTRRALLLIRAEERGTEAVSALSRLEVATRRFEVESRLDTRPEHADVRLLSGFARGVGLHMLDHADEAANELVKVGRTAVTMGRTVLGLAALDRAAHILGAQGRWLQADDLRLELVANTGTQPMASAYRTLTRSWRAHNRCEQLDRPAVKALVQQPFGGLELIAEILLAVSDDGPEHAGGALPALESLVGRAHGRYPEYVALLAPRALAEAARVGGRQRTEALAARMLECLGTDCLESDLIEALVNPRSKVAGARLRDALSGRRRTWAATTRTTSWLVVAAEAAHTGHRVGAEEALRRALVEAMPLHLVRPFLEADPRVRELLLGARGRLGHLEPFSEAIALVFATQADDGARLALTNRELTILRDLPSVLTLAEIAEVHVISVNTVKTHLRSMYRKLEVSGRAQAVQRARRLGIF